MGMRVRVAVTMAAPVRYRDRHHHDMAVTDAALGDDLLGERLHFAPRALQHGDLETALGIDMHMQSGLREIAVIVRLLRQPFWQIARGVIVDVAERRDAVAAVAAPGISLFETAAQQVAKRLRTVGIAAPLLDGAAPSYKSAVDRSRLALHPHSPAAPPLFYFPYYILLPRPQPFL